MKSILENASESFSDGDADVFWMMVLWKTLVEALSKSEIKADDFKINLKVLA